MDPQQEDPGGSNVPSNMNKPKVYSFLMTTPSQARVYGMLIGLSEIWLSGTMYPSNPILCSVFAVLGVVTLVVRTHDDGNPS